MTKTPAPVPRTWVVLLALVALDVVLSFDNVVQTPLVRWSGAISIELVVLVLVIAAATRMGFRLSTPVRAAVAAGIVLAALVRYADVTTKGVLGRELDLAGDLPHLVRVFDMFVTSMSAWTIAGVLGALALAAAAAFWVSFWSLGVLGRAAASNGFPRYTAAAAAVLLTWYLVLPGAFAEPAAAVVARHVSAMRNAELEKRRLEAEGFPPLEVSSNLAGLDGADVILIFVESYGVTLVEDEVHAGAILPRFRRLEQRLAEAGVHAVSRQIHSPTFGGGSWRAHATLLSGLRIDTEQRYEALLSSERETLVGALSRHGYRTAAVEPGIQWLWPEGLFYGFDEIYDQRALDYQGPAMGWWKVPDQYTLHKLCREELAPAPREPLFAKVSLLATHIPYYPIPEYVEDWSRFDEGTAYAEGLRSVAHDAYRDLSELSTWYVKAFEYELDVLEGFLLRCLPQNALVVVVGDHQPPKLATHDNDSWAVPMHVISRRPDLVAPFPAHDFRDGLVPLHGSSLKMEEFAELFLDTYHRERRPLATDQ